MTVGITVKRRKEDPRGPTGTGRIVEISDTRAGRRYASKRFALVQWGARKTWVEMVKLEAVEAED